MHLQDLEVQFLLLVAPRLLQVFILFTHSLHQEVWLLQVDLDLLMFSSSVAAAVVAKITTQVVLVDIMVEALAVVVLEHSNILKDYQ
jgi:hypothetical protein|tara:strand:+ start:345 stop:605 length:261 start_codon:yes stop_codon:yes gene_type:complete